MRSFFSFGLIITLIFRTVKFRVRTTSPETVAIGGGLQRTEMRSKTDAMRSERTD